MSGVQAKVVAQSEVVPGQFVVPLALFNEDGTPFTGGSTPAAATASTAGVVKLAAVTPQVAADDATAAAGTAPTKAEFDALVTLANANKEAINSIINAARSAGQAASS